MRFIEKKYVYQSSLILSILIGITSFIYLYSLNWTLIAESFTENQGALGIVLIISGRIGILSGMVLYIFYEWFKQEEQYLSDIPFLFGIFFLFLAFGKALDLFNDFMYFKLDNTLRLLIFKARYIILILDLFPMIFLSIDMLLFSLSLKDRFERLTNEKIRSKIKRRLLVLIITIELMAGIMVQSIELLSILYPIVAIPSLITIVWLFNFAWRNKRLSQVNTHILMIGFGLCLISQIIRPLLQFVVGESPKYVIIAESIDLIIFTIIFIGFYKKSNYSTL